MGYPKYSTDDVIDCIKKDKNLKEWFNDYTVCSEVQNHINNNYDSQCYLESFNTHNAQPTYEFMSLLRTYLDKNMDKLNIESYEVSKEIYRVRIDFVLK